MPPLSDDEYEERFREAASRCVFAECGFYGSLVHLSRTTEEAAQAMNALGHSLTAVLEESLSTLSLEEYERYEELRALGLLPFDALANLECSDDEIVAFLFDDRDE